MIYNLIDEEKREINRQMINEIEENKSVKRSLL